MPILNLLLSLGKKKTYCYLVSPTIGAPLLVLLPSDLWRVVPVDHHTHHAQNIPTYGLLYTEGQVTIILSPLSIQFLFPHLVETLGCYSSATKTSSDYSSSP
ncbi:unnamed protein product [Cuscuta epithymum]|uniref:Fatty acid hydroxylase domain-containing protein n=1 Tax=Cuscuta epithymum TaxID=186058 RepID=A0AAV0E1S3_9ASTE|nr:unnamed protein product [Cuscuta epithymum]